MKSYIEILKTILKFVLKGKGTDVATAIFFLKNTAGGITTLSQSILYSYSNQECLVLSCVVLTAE